MPMLYEGLISSEEPLYDDNLLYGGGIPDHSSDMLYGGSFRGFFRGLWNKILKPAGKFAWPLLKPILGDLMQRGVSRGLSKMPTYIPPKVQKLYSKVSEYVPPAFKKEVGRRIVSRVPSVLQPASKTALGKIGMGTSRTTKSYKGRRKTFRPLVF